MISPQTLLWWYFPQKCLKCREILQMLWKNISTKYKPILKPALSFFLFQNDRWLSLTGLGYSWGTFGAWQTWQNRMDLPEDLGKEEGKACLMWHIFNNPKKGKLEKFRSQHLANSSFPNMLGKCVPELNAGENHAKRRKWKCPHSQFNVAKCVPGNMVSKAYWVNRKILYQ